jgi:hypothetical protein
VLHLLIVSKTSMTEGDEHSTASSVWWRNPSDTLRQVRLSSSDGEEHHPFKTEDGVTT